MPIPWAVSKTLVAALLLILGAAPVKAAEPLSVAVAANFHGTLEELAARYEAEHGQRLRLSANSSGALYTQIRRGAPFVLFFSADAERPERLVAEGLALADSRFTYAHGVPVLWSARVGVVDAEAEVLREGDFRHLALAEPRNAPYGAVARQVLEALGLWEELAGERRLTRAGSIGQAYSQVASGAAPLGFVALSQVRREDGTIPGSHWFPPAELHEPVRQEAVILSRAEADPRTLEAARAFMAWLRGDEARAVIAAAGYTVEE